LYRAGNNLVIRAQSRILLGPLLLLLKHSRLITRNTYQPKQFILLIHDVEHCAAAVKSIRMRMVVLQAAPEAASGTVGETRKVPKHFRFQHPLQVYMAISMIDEAWLQS
jgi:hypothetical protein